MVARFAESLSRTFYWMSRCREGDSQVRRAREPLWLARTGRGRPDIDADVALIVSEGADDWEKRSNRAARPRS